MSKEKNSLSLEVELDCRLITHPEIVEWLERVDTTDEAKVELMKMFRFCYGMGYIEAFTEPIIASLYKDHGYQLPKRKQPNKINE